MATGPLAGAGPQEIDEYWMQAALKQAEMAFDAGEVVLQGRSAQFQPATVFFHLSRNTRDYVVTRDESKAA